MLKILEKTSLAWKEAVDRDRIFEFLVGLNPKYDHMCSFVFGRSILLSLDGVFAMIRGEETKRAAMLGDKQQDIALAANKKFQRSNQGKKKHKDDIWCEKCKK